MTADGAWPVWRRVSPAGFHGLDGMGKNYLSKFKEVPTWEPTYPLPKVLF